MKYIIELNKVPRTHYLGWYNKELSHIVFRKEEATKYKKQQLAGIYKKFGRENVKVHKCEN